MGAEISDALKRGAKRCVGPWQLQGEKGITPLFNKENKRGDVRYDVTFRRVRVNHCSGGTEIRITYSEYVSVALGIQHAMRMRHTEPSSVACFTIFCHVILKTA